jgi:hypothetical protein
MPFIWRWALCDFFLDCLEYHSLKAGTLLLGQGQQGLEYRLR